MSRARIVTTSIVAAAVLAFAGCGSSSSGSKSTTTSAKSQSQSTSGTTGGSGKTSGKALSCDLVTPAEIGSALGLTVGAPEVRNNDPVTLCTYKTSDGTGQVLVRFETGVDAAGWEAVKAGFGQHGEPTQDLAGLGDKALTSTIGSGQFVTNTVVTQKGTTNLLITTSASLAQIEALARRILPSL